MKRKFLSLITAITAAAVILTGCGTVNSNYSHSYISESGSSSSSFGETSSSSAFDNDSGSPSSSFGETSSSSSTFDNNSGSSSYVAESAVSSSSSTVSAPPASYSSETYSSSSQHETGLPRRARVLDTESDEFVLYNTYGTQLSSPTFLLTCSISGLICP